MDDHGILLRPITEEDTPLIVRWRNLDSVRMNFLYRQSFTIEGHTQWLHTMVFTGKVAQFIIMEGHTKLPIGSVFLRDIDPVHNKAEFGIFIGEDAARGKGYGTQAAIAIKQYGFETLHLHKIFLRVLKTNGGAIRSYEKAGFVVEGIFRDELLIDGAYVDVVFMAAFSDH